MKDAAGVPLIGAARVPQWAPPESLDRRGRSPLDRHGPLRSLGRPAGRHGPPASSGGKAQRCAAPPCQITSCVSQLRSAPAGAISAYRMAAANQKAPAAAASMNGVETPSFQVSLTATASRTTKVSL